MSIIPGWEDYAILINNLQYNRQRQFDLGNKGIDWSDIQEKENGFLPEDWWGIIIGPLIDWLTDSHWIRTFIKMLISSDLTRWGFVDDDDVCKWELISVASAGIANLTGPSMQCEPISHLI